LDACHHGSRHFEDDTEKFFFDLKRGMQISMFAAPAIKSNFTHWSRMLTWLRQQGVQLIYDVSLGADICTWAHIRYLQKHGIRPLISQPCPAIVNYILMYKNDLMRYLSPVHSPMLCTAVLMKKYERVNMKIAALSPCIAKANEFDSTRMVDYNVTFTKLQQYIQENNVVFPHESSGFDSYESGLGSLYPMPGGLKESVENYLGKSIRIDKSEGTAVVYKALDEYAHKPETKLPILFDVLNCAEGCNMGTGCKHDKDIFDITTSMNDIRQAVIKDSKKQYLDEIFEKFDETLKLEDFTRTYNAMPIRSIPVTEEAINKAYLKMNKDDEASRTFDCGACGYDTCHEMARQIAKGLNNADSCIEKAHKDVLREHQIAKEELSSFESVLNDTTIIKEMTENIVSNVGNITDSIMEYNNMITEIERIALQVNIISLNASIEAARAGQHGKSFAVVAEEIRRLARLSSESAEKTKVTSEKATNAVKAVNGMVSQISGSVNSSYENIYGISERIKGTLNEED
jgi:hypothetical protein